MFPELLKLMAHKQINQTELAKIIGISQQALSKKLNGESEFKRLEMIKIKDFFSDTYPDVRMDNLFTTEIFLP